MKVLVVANCPAVDYLGSGYVIKNFSEGLRSLGHEVDIFGPEHFHFMEWMAPRANQYRTAVGMYRFVRQQLKRKPYDIIEFYGGECALAVKHLVKQKDRKFMVIHHSNGPEPKYDELKRQLNPKEFKWFQLKRSTFLSAGFSLPDGVITVSEDDEAWLEKKGWPYSGLRKAVLPCLPDQLLGLKVDYDKKEKVIGYCGTWIPRKGISIMENDIPKILRNYPDWKFRIIGQSLAFNKGDFFPSDVLSQIEVVPFIKEKKQLINEYLKLSIFIMPSFFESFGLVLAEAMACGCATVANKVGFVYSLKDKKEVLVMEEKASPYLYKKLALLISDESLRRQIAQNGHSRVQQLRWTDHIAILDQTYDEWKNRL